MRDKIVGIIGLLIGLFALNYLISLSRVSWDLTADKRYTFSGDYKEVLDSVNQEVDVTVYLTGDLPAMFKRLESSVEEKLDLSQRRNYRVQYRFVDPSAGSDEVVSNRRKTLVEKGLIPIRLKINQDNTEKLIFPYAIFRNGDREVIVNLLEADKPGIPSEETIHRSITLLEYKFATAFTRVFQRARKKIYFTTGHEELDDFETADLDNSLSAYYDVSRVLLDTIQFTSEDADLLIVAQPKKPFSDNEKLVLDQFIMNGGSVLFLIDALGVSNQQLQATGETVSFNYEHNLDDLLFRYGVRIKPDFVLDMECSRIPLIVGQMGGENQYELFPWYYHLVPPPRNNHEIVANLDRVNLLYASSIDTLKTPLASTITTLLASSDRSQLQFHPADIRFDILRNPPDPSAFNQKSQVLGVLIEGEIESLYKNRITSTEKNYLSQKGLPFTPSQEESKIIVVSDGDIAKNDYDLRTNRPLPLGFNKYENYQFANSDFLQNSIEYLIEKHPLLELRNRQLNLYLLDKIKAEENKSFWQFLNLFIPSISILLLWFIIYLSRRKFKT